MNLKGLYFARDFMRLNEGQWKEMFVLSVFSGFFLAVTRQRLLPRYIRWPTRRAVHLTVHRHFEHVRRYVALVDELCIILSDRPVQVLTSQRPSEQHVPTRSQWTGPPILLERVLCKPCTIPRVEDEIDNQLLGTSSSLRISDHYLHQLRMHFCGTIKIPRIFLRYS